MKPNQTYGNEALSLKKTSGEARSSGLALLMKKTAAAMAAGMLIAALAAGCGSNSSVKQQQLNQRDDTQGGTGNKTHSGNLHTK